MVAALCKALAQSKPGGRPFRLSSVALFCGAGRVPAIRYGRGQ